MNPITLKCKQQQINVDYSILSKNVQLKSELKLLNETKIQNYKDEIEQLKMINENLNESTIDCKI